MDGPDGGDPGGGEGPDGGRRDDRRTAGDGGEDPLASDEDAFGGDGEPFAGGEDPADEFDRRDREDRPGRRDRPDPGAAAGAAGESSDGLLGIDWSPRADRVTNGDRLRAVGVTVGLGAGGFLVALVVSQVALLALAAAGVSVTELSFVGQLIFGFVVLQGISFPLVALGYLRYRGLALSYLRARLPSLRDLGWVVGGFLLLIALLTAVLITYSAVGAETAERSDTQDFQENPTAILVMIPVSILLIGPAEELLFRGVIQTRLRETFGPPGAIVLANGAFAPLHIFALTGSPTALVFTIGALFVPGLVFGTVYEITDNLVVPSLVHGIYNALIFASFYASATAAGGGSAVLAL